MKTVSFLRFRKTHVKVSFLRLKIKKSTYFMSYQSDERDNRFLFFTVKMGKGWDSLLIIIVVTKVCVR
jgi:hypothetical protein